MKALALTLALMISLLNMNASENAITKRGRKGNFQKERLQTAVDHQVNRHIFNPDRDDENKLEGKADVMLRLMPQGDIHVVLIQTNNALLKKFIEKQVKKMKIDKKEVVAGQIFKYRFVFKAKE